MRYAVAGPGAGDTGASMGGRRASVIPDVPVELQVLVSFLI